MATVVSKRYDASTKKIESERQYGVEEAMALVKEMPGAKFDESVDLAFRLGVDPKHADQMVRGAVVMPNGTGKTTRVAVFAKGPKAKEAEAAGADIVGADDLHDRIAGGFMDFDKVIATPDMMGVVGKLGRVLGPRGLMPNPKVGTVTMDVTKAVKESKAGKVEYKVEKAGIVHCGIGKTSMESDKLVENFKALFENILRQKPASSKGNYVKSVTVSSTMGPGVKIDIADATAMSSAAEE